MIMLRSTPVLVIAAFFLFQNVSAISDKQSANPITTVPSYNESQAEPVRFKVETVPGMIITIDLGETFEEFLQESVGELTFSWSRSDDSLAAGAFLTGSSRSGSMLQLVDLLPGNYTFIATKMINKIPVESKQISLEVVDSKTVDFIFNVHVDVSIKKFTFADEKIIAEALYKILSNIDNTCSLIISDVKKNVAKDSVVVQVMVNCPEDKQSSVNAEKIFTAFRQAYLNGALMGNIFVERITAENCPYTCSGRGYCDAYTSTCVCQDGFMPDWNMELIEGVPNCAQNASQQIVITAITVEKNKTNWLALLILSSVFLVIALLLIAIILRYRSILMISFQKRKQKLLNKPYNLISDQVYYSSYKAGAEPQK